MRNKILKENNIITNRYCDDVGMCNMWAFVMIVIYVFINVHVLYNIFVSV